jgi:hypothetical protein
VANGRGDRRGDQPLRRGWRRSDHPLAEPGRADEVRLYVPPTRYYARIRVVDDVVYVERVMLSP